MYCTDDLDIERFWKDDSASREGNCFAKSTMQPALGIRMSDECVFAELGEEGEPWGYTERERRIELNKRYNEKALKTVGKSLLVEEYPPEDSYLPGTVQIGKIFGGEYTYEAGTYWLHGDFESEKDLEKMLDNVEKADIREMILPERWEYEKKRIFETYGNRPSQFMGIRGPITLMNSLYGTERMLYLMCDAPELCRRFSDAIADVVIKYIKIMITESGKTLDNFEHGFYFADDDCNLLTPELYENFGYPVLKKVFDFAAPNAEDTRYQHSDSAMGHLLPILSRLNLTGCNFGPTLTVREIRKHMPKTCIDGQVAPFTFMSNDETKIIEEVKRDCEMAKENDLRGLNLSCAGSINNGSLLTSMKAVMWAVQKYGQYN